MFREAEVIETQARTNAQLAAATVMTPQVFTILLIISADIIYVVYF